MYDSNPQTNSNISMSQASYASDQDLTKTPNRNTSSNSIEMSEELALIKREVASLKDQVWNRVHNDLVPSEDCSVQNSLLDAQVEYPDEKTNSNVNTAEASKFQSDGKFVPGVQDKPQAIAYSTRSSCEDNNQLGKVISVNDNLQNKDDIFFKAEKLYNGVFIERASAIDNKMYVFASVTNDILLPESQSAKARKTESRLDPLISKRIEIGNMSNRSKSSLAISNNFLLNESLQQKSQSKENCIKPEPAVKTKYKELISAPPSALNSVHWSKSKSLPGNPEKGDLCHQRNQDLARTNERILEEGGPEDTEEAITTHPLLKKTLSVIYSTNESIESTPPQSVGRTYESRPHTEASPRKSARMIIKESDSSEVIKEQLTSSDKPNLESTTTERSEGKKSMKAIQTVETDRHITYGDAPSSLGSEETFLGLLYVTKLQSKNNKEIENKLTRLGELYNKQIEKYEKTIQMLNEKNEKYNKGNELLVKTLKTCEKEIDTLALNNQTLHKNILMFEEDLNKKRSKEKQLIETNATIQKENEKLKEELQKKDIEFEDIKKKLAASIAKIENVKLYSKTCEESIFAIDQTLRKVLADKGGPRMSIIIINKVIESIFAETSKFIQKLERASTVPAAILETEAKSPSSKENLRFFTSSLPTEESNNSTIDLRDKIKQACPIQKQRSKTPDSKKLAPSPNTKTPGSVRHSLESPKNAVDNKVLLQRLLNTNGANPRSSSNNSRQSFDHRKSTDTSGDNLDTRSTKTWNQPSCRRESYSPTPCEKSSDKIKPKPPIRMVTESDKIKENLRKKIIRNVSPINSKKI